MIRELRSFGYRISRWNSRLRIVPSTSIFDPAMRWRSVRQSGWRNWRLSWEIAWLMAGDVVNVVSSFPAIATFGKGPPLFASTPLELKQLFFSQNAGRDSTASASTFVLGRFGPKRNGCDTKIGRNGSYGSIRRFLLITQS